MKKAPAHLSIESRQLWYKISRSYINFDEYGFLLLRTALEAYDRLQLARRAIDTEGAIYTTPTGFKKEHPALKVEKQSRDGFLAALRMLGLNLSEPGDIGRPPGS